MNTAVDDSNRLLGLSSASKDVDPRDLAAFKRSTNLDELCICGVRGSQIL